MKRSEASLSKWRTYMSDGRGVFRIFATGALALEQRLLRDVDTAVHQQIEDAIGWLGYQGTGPAFAPGPAAG